MIGLLLLLALECPATVMGSVELYAKVFYLHEDPNHLTYRYTFTTDVEIFTNVTVYLHAQGRPVAAEWYSRSYGSVSKAAVEFELAKTCGEIPSPRVPVIFVDEFETGNTNRWSGVFPPLEIFDDGFETGDTRAWSRTEGD